MAFAAGGRPAATDGGERVKVLLLQLDGARTLPNIALMRIAAHHAELGDTCELRYAPDEQSVPPHLGDHFDLVYASAIFQKTRPVVDVVLREWPGVIVGGTGVDVAGTLERHGITTVTQDYSIYPEFRFNIGFARRGCRLRCPFCVVPLKEGAVRNEQTIGEIWRGEPYPRDLILLDNDFFAPGWEPLVEEIRNGGFRVSFNQGINARMLTPEVAEAIASIDYRDDSFTRKRLYTAWDNRKDEARLFSGLETLARHGVKPDHVMVYMLIGYWPGETHEDREYRRAKLREFGARPYPMPYVRTRELVGFQTWVIGAYDKRVPWDAWQASGYNPRKLNLEAASDSALFEKVEEC